MESFVFSSESFCWRRLKLFSSAFATSSLGSGSFISAGCVLTSTACWASGSALISSLKAIRALRSAVSACASESSLCSLSPSLCVTSMRLLVPDSNCSLVSLYWRSREERFVLAVPMRRCAEYSA